MRDLHFMVTRGGLISPVRAVTDAKSVAQSLGFICRFAGNGAFYSVLVHSILVCMLAPKEARLHALVHDASEIAVSDVPSPMKTDSFRAQERTIQARILEALGVPAPTPRIAKLVHKADHEALLGEIRIISPALSKYVKQRSRRAENLVRKLVKTYPPSDTISNRSRAVKKFVQLFDELKKAS